MKKLILTLAVSVMLMLPCLAQQPARIPVVTDSTFFYADSISETINLEKNLFLGQIWLDADRSTTVKIQLYDESKQKWSWLHDVSADAVYVATVDSTIDNVIPLQPIRMYVGKDLRFIISNDPADTLSMRYDMRGY